MSKRQDRCIVYSFGVWTESSFEAEMLERSECEVWMFDFSVNKVIDREPSALLVES